MHSRLRWRIATTFCARIDLNANRANTVIVLFRFLLLLCCCCCYCLSLVIQSHIVLVRYMFTGGWYMNVIILYTLSGWMRFLSHLIWLNAFTHWERERMNNKKKIRIYFFKLSETFFLFFFFSTLKKPD